MTDYNNLSLSELIKNTSSIIGGGKSSKEDIKTLTQIRWFMSIKYRDTNMEGSAKEGLYNGDRSKNTVEFQETMAVGKAENQSKALAEISYGNYREINADAAGINKLINGIDTYIISCNIENKVGTNTQF